MLTHDELAELYRSLRQEKVLSVYLDGKATDFAERTAWRRRLEHELSHARKRVNGTGEPEATWFDKAAARIDDALAPYDNFLPDHGWVGFATADALAHGTPLRVPMPDLVRWEDGIRVAPYVRALKQERLVLGAVVDSRRARLFTYRGGALSEPENLNADTFVGDLTDINVSKRASSHTGVRGKTGTDAAQKYQGVGSDRMYKQLADVLMERVGKEGHLVIGGTPEVVAAAVHHLPDSVGARTIERPGLRFEMSDAELRAAVEAAASDLNQALQADRLTEVIDLAKSGGRGALGIDAVEKALRESRVDTLFVSRGFISASPDYADHLVGAAFEQHADLEELSHEGGGRLDAEGEGVAARLRYTL